VVFNYHWIFTFFFLRWWTFREVPEECLRRSCFKRASG